MTIRFPSYRSYTKARVEVNDSMVALFVGTRISKHILEQKDHDKNTYLPAIFDEIPDITRLNRTPEDAAKLLLGAEQDLAYMSIPHTLAIYGAFLVDVASLLRENGFEPKTLRRKKDLNKLNLEEVHEYLMDCCDKKFSDTWLSLFHFSRCIRNRIIHASMTPGSHLRGIYLKLSDDAKQTWRRTTGRSFIDVLDSKKLPLNRNEMFAVLSITLRLSEEVNEMIKDTISRSAWAQIAVNDFRTQYPSGKNKNMSVETRKMLAFAKMTYGPLNLDKEELAEAQNKIA